MPVSARTLSFPKGPSTQIMGLWGPNSIDIVVFGPYRTLLLGSFEPQVFLYNRWLASWQQEGMVIEQLSAKAASSLVAYSGSSASMLRQDKDAAMTVHGWKAGCLHFVARGKDLFHWVGEVAPSGSHRQIMDMTDMSPRNFAT